MVLKQQRVALAAQDLVEGGREPVGFPGPEKSTSSGSALPVLRAAAGLFRSAARPGTRTG
ncbi:MAG: hypothetical protein MZV70_37665 [Desulfobacterales bacterium]|nr:hypothetical protein [Desulfobacterales bacterium]